MAFMFKFIGFGWDTQYGKAGLENGWWERAQHSWTWLQYLLARSGCGFEEQIGQKIRNWINI